MWYLVSLLFFLNACQYLCRYTSYYANFKIKVCISAITHEITITQYDNYWHFTCTVLETGHCLDFNILYGDNILYIVYCTWNGVVSAHIINIGIIYI